jgi:hypothetical protein
MRALFPLVADAVSRVLPIASLRWISFGHVEADECGAMNHRLEAVPDARVAFSGLGCMVSINDLADRPPRPLDDGESIDLGDKQVRYLATPHVPHGWEAGVLFEETTSTLLCGDLFTQTGDGPAICNDSPMEPTIAAEDVFGYSTLTPSTAAPSSGSPTSHQQHSRSCTGPPIRAMENSGYATSPPTTATAPTSPSLQHETQSGDARRSKDCDEPSETKSRVP